MTLNFNITLSRDKKKLLELKMTMVMDWNFYQKKMTTIGRLIK